MLADLSAIMQLKEKGFSKEHCFKNVLNLL